MGKLVLVALWAAPSAPQESAEAEYVRGLQLYNAGDFGAAVEALSRAAILASNVPDYRYHLGLAYLRVDKVREAARELEATLGMMGVSRETRLREPMVLVEAAKAYVRLGNYATARKRIDLALERGEDSAEAHYVLGLVEAEGGNEARALEAFRAAVERERDHPDANLALAERLTAAGKSEEARDHFRHASHGRPSFEIAMALGGLSFRAHDLPEAEEAFAYAHRLRPADDAAAYNLGTVLLARGKYDEAIAALRPLAEREVPHDAACFNLAAAYRQSGSLEAARDVLRALVARRSDFEGAAFSLALVLETLGELEEAEKSYREALERRPADAPALLNLAALLEGRGRSGDARALLKRALELPLDPEMVQAIREAMGRLGEK